MQPASVTEHTTGEGAIMAERNWDFKMTLDQIRRQDSLWLATHLVGYFRGKRGLIEPRPCSTSCGVAQRGARWDIVVSL